MKNTNIQRRQFLQTLAALSGGTALNGLAGLIPALPLEALASQFVAQGDQRFFVLLKMEGGWDVTLSLDPWLAAQKPNKDDLFIEYTQDQLIQAGSYFLGPAAQSLVPFANEIAIVNGVFMNDADTGHTPSLNYIMSGNGNGKMASLPVEVALASRLEAFGVIADGPVSLSTRSALISNTASMLKMGLTKASDDLVESYLEDANEASPLTRARRAFLENQDKIKVLGNLIGSFPNPEQMNSGQIVAATFASELCRQAQLEIRPQNAQQLDTHSGHEGVHLRAQAQRWEMVADIFKTFKSVPYGKEGKSLFDHTTFMVVSEFSRTPTLNNSGGKDHNPFLNSVLFAGGSVAGGQVVGGSHLVTREESPNGASYHIAKPMDLATGRKMEVRGQGTIITPEIIAQTAGLLTGCSRPLIAGSKKVAAIEKIVKR